MHQVFLSIPPSKVASCSQYLHGCVCCVCVCGCVYYCYCISLHVWAAGNQF